MKVDSVITLENDMNCLLLEKATLENENYFLSVVLNESEEPSDEYVVLKEILKDDKQFVIKEDDEQILVKLLNLFTLNLNSEMTTITD